MSTPDLTPDASTLTRKPRLLWANVYCLLDTSSGASMAVRQMLLQLAAAGWEVDILGATVFDHERGTVGLQGQWETLRGKRGQFMQLGDGPLTHTVLVPAQTARGHMTSAEESSWFAMYTRKLETLRPDVVFYYGGQAFDHLIAVEARAAGIPVAFYVANGNYTKKRWCRDVELILTDSQATADLYKARLGIDVTPVGAFIDPTRVVAAEHTRQHLLFVNPTPEKGAAIVARLAMLMEKSRPDIRFEVVESRGRWQDALRSVSASVGEPRDALTNVTLTPHTADMRPLYSRARLLLAPSLWWESSGRVLAEAMLNGVPAIITAHGGMPEMVGAACIQLKLPEACHQAPYNKLPTDAALLPLIERIEALYDDQAQYQALVAQAYREGQARHSLQVSTARLLQALQTLPTRKAP